MGKKYKLTEETIEVEGKTLYRIQALKDVNEYVEKRDLGGFVESEENLSQDGECWVFENAMVYEDARVYGDARIRHNSKVYGNAKVYEDAWIGDNSKVYGNARVYGKAWILGNSVIKNIELYENRGYENYHWSEETPLGKILNG